MELVIISNNTWGIIFMIQPFGRKCEIAFFNDIGSTYNFILSAFKAMACYTDLSMKDFQKTVTSI